MGTVEASELALGLGGGSPGVGVESAKCNVKFCVGKVGMAVIFCKGKVGTVGISGSVGIFRKAGMFGIEETLCNGMEGIVGTGLARGLEGLLGRGVGEGVEALEEEQEERGVGEGSETRGPLGVAIGSYRVRGVARGRFH